MIICYGYIRYSTTGVARALRWLLGGPINLQGFPKVEIPGFHRSLASAPGRRKKVIGVFEGGEAAIEHPKPRSREDRGLIYH
jgi:hypothetical protein